MHIVLTILAIVAGIVALLLIIALFTKKGYTTHSEIIIDAPRQTVFEYLKHIKNQDNYNQWLMPDPGMKKEFKGTDGTVGFIYGWNGNKKGGEGEQEIKAITEGEMIEMELRFVRPFAGVAHAKMTTESLSDPDSHQETKVTWNTASNMSYPMNLMLPMIVKMLEKDMSTSLTTLKAILKDNRNV